MAKKTHIVIHHSLTKDSGSVSWGAIERYHRSLGWDGIGYHVGFELLSDSTGAQFYAALAGRPILKDGAHCFQGGMNKVGVGVCFVGNFDEAPPSMELLRFAVPQIAGWMAALEIPVENVVPHREFAPYKTCPGKMFDMDLLRKMLRGA